MFEYIFVNILLNLKNMKELKKIKLKDVCDKQTLNVDQLSKITGGTEIENGCDSGVCENNRDYGTKFCSGGSVCTQAVSTCTENT
jgi:natural product precursor